MNWDECINETTIRKLHVTAWRVVEAQHKSTTRKLVDTLLEHDLLEDLIESAKPKIDDESKKKYDYLLYTPFRYPPLTHGSRFGHCFEPSLWYGSVELSTALTERAYYRLVFMHHTDAELNYTECLLTAFTAEIDTNLGLDLTVPPFASYKNKLSPPNTYLHSQPLGTAMRKKSIIAFKYLSARTKEKQFNVGVFKPIAFKQTKPNSEFQTWRCFATKSTVEFHRENVAAPQHYNFHADQFKIEGILHAPPSWATV